MMTRYVFNAKVLSVYEHKIAVQVPCGTDPETGRTKYNQEMRGTGEWFVRMDGSSALSFGHEKPDFGAGDKVRITVEREL